MGPDAEVEVVKLAAKLADSASSNRATWLKRFRIFYRHLAASVDAGGRAGRSPAQERELTESETAVAELGQ